MAKTTRVHILAKELGVKSKAIVEKCQAEGLDVKNHMATISVGLAATIREWFSEGDHKTIVEKSERVDLDKVKVKKDTSKAEPKDEKKAAELERAKKVAAVAVEPEEARPRPRVEEEAPEVAEEDETPETETKQEPELEEEPEETEEVQEEAPKAEEEVPAEETAEEPVKAEQTAEEEKKTIKADEEKPKKEERIIPAGPMLTKPQPAKLSGPRVIRVEEVEPEEKKIPRRPPARRSRPRYDEPVTQPLMPKVAEDSGSQKKTGKRSKRKIEKPEEGGEKVSKTKARMRARDLDDRRARLAAARGDGIRLRPSRRIENKKKKFEAASAQRPERATVAEPISVKDLSAAIAAKTSEIIGKLMGMGIMATANQTIDTEVAEMIALDLGTELIVEHKLSLQQQLEKEFENRERKQIERRPPVITMLGHVDHGKTSLLDRIRSTSVADGEAGGITQHIGSYQVEWKGRKITFLDTPGHEAFTAMRARGANMTDIVVLVVAADDGLMPQTIEAIHHAKAAGVDMIVALNKIDLPGVDINRIYGQLAEHDMTPTEWSGNTEIVKTSAITGEGIEDLIEHLDYIAELKNYEADSTVPATGWIVESKMSATQGPVATILLKEGNLKKGDVVLAGDGYGRIRTMKDGRGVSISKATSSMAVEISGLSDVPQAGDKFFCLKDDIIKAQKIAEENKVMSREQSLARKSQITLDNLFSQIEAGNVKELNLIVKADVQGSVDVLIKYLTELSTEEIKVKVMHAAVGGINQGDVVLAEASGAIIVGFNVVPDDKVKEIAEQSGVDIRLYNIIYRITEDVRNAMLGMLDAKFEEKHVGKLIVRDVFRHSRIGAIAGCYVSDGSIFRDSTLKLIRDNIIIRDKCKIESLKHFKEDVREVKAGNECGVKIANFDDVKLGDVLEVFEVVELEKKL